jgi:hypothetical protein
LVKTGPHGRATPWSRLPTELAWHILPPLAYLLLMLRWFPHWNAFWIYSDEGYNVMKALLVSRGYTLYSQIWSDQPPLFTHLLAVLYRVNGPTVFASRVLVLLFSCLLIWAAVQYLRLAWGNGAALAGALLVILLPFFPSLSASALVGQPSLAMAVVSMLALAAWHRSGSRLYLILSAAALSLSLLFKLFTIFLVPIFAAGLLASEFFPAGVKSALAGRMRPLLLWALVLMIFTLVLGFMMTGAEGIVQIIQPHIAASQADFSSGTQNYPITFYLRDSWSILLLAGVGAVYTIVQRRWLMFYSLAWMAAAGLILLNLSPVWFHHQMLVTIPAALLAGGAVAETVQLLRQALRAPTGTGVRWIWLASGLAIIILVLATRPLKTIDQFQLPGSAPGEVRAPFEDRVMRKINQYADQTEWMVTDLPMFAFRAGIPVPPELAVISGKRFAAGELSEQDIIDKVKQYQPEQVLIGRFELPLLEQYLNGSYLPILEREGELRLYVRADLLR